MLVIAGHIRIDPTKREEATAAAVTMMQETHKEDGCIAYVFSESLDDEGLYYIFEKWESEGALDAHFAAPHMAEFQGKMGGFGVKEMNVEKYGISSVGPVR
jgi:quinol monooxygenase YgiN